MSLLPCVLHTGSYTMHSYYDYLLKVIFSLIPCPLFPHDIVGIWYCADTMMYSSDTITLDPFSSLETLTIIALAARPVPLRLPACN